MSLAAASDPRARRAGTRVRAGRAAPPFPVALILEGRPCLVVGAGREGEGKIAGLLAAGASVRVVAPRATRTVREWAREGRVRREQRAFEAADLDGAFLVVIATSSPAVNEIVWREARRRGVLCNAVDDPPHCDFYYPAVVRRGSLQIAISTDGKSPALAQRLRRELEEQFGGEYEAWIEHLGRKRELLFGRRIDPELRRRRLHALASDASFQRFVRARRQAADAKENHDGR
jgi:precorrin-2 dehydrogenase